MSSTSERVKDIIVNKLGVSDDEVKDEAWFVEDLGADSLDIVELIMDLEEEFGIAVEDEELVPENLDSIKNVTEYLERKM